MTFYYALDVGGSSIKCTIADNGGGLVCEPVRFPSYSCESKDAILGQLAKSVSYLENKAKERALTISGAGWAFPGPFDYENGVSLMKGMGKFDAIYLCNIQKELCSLFDKKMPPMRFANDADLYALGEANFGQGKGFSRVMCICIGSGIGSGFCIDGHLVKLGEGVPENGWIYNTPYKDLTADAYASASGIRRMMLNDISLRAVPDVKELAAEALNGNKSALSIFERFKEIVKETVLPHALKFRADCVVVGGDVAKSASLFISGLENALCKEGIALKVSREFSNITLRAVPTLF